jgi:cation transport ATPase
LAVSVEFTVTTAVVVHPPLLVYTIVEVPIDNAVTIPPDEIVATDGLVLLHEQPALPDVSGEELPTHNVSGPRILPGWLFTVT